MIKQLTLVSLFSVLALGCGKSPCEEAFDIALECGDANESERDQQIALCEGLFPEDGIQQCVDCTSAAADSCTAGDPGGPCETQCNFSL